MIKGIEKEVIPNVFFVQTFGVTSKTILGIRNIGNLMRIGRIAFAKLPKFFNLSKKPMANIKRAEQKICSALSNDTNAINDTNAPT